MEEIYKQDGVDVAAGDDLSARAQDICQSTWQTPFGRVVSVGTTKTFRGPRVFKSRLEYRHFLTGGFSLDSDGLGTKPSLHCAAGTYRAAGHDLLAMLLDDVTRYGGLPLAISNVLDVNTTSQPTAIIELLQGLKDASKEQCVAIINGEIAEMGEFVGGETISQDVLRFLWSGTVQGFFDPERMITGENVQPGDFVIALKEQGFRCNGIISVRKALRRWYGHNWSTTTDSEARDDIHAAAAPSVCYSRLLTYLNGWPENSPRVPIKHIAHITGGGIPGKFGHDLLRPLGLSAELDDLYTPPDIMCKCAQWRGMNSKELYETWNGGQGALLTVAYEQVNNVLDAAKMLGIGARVAGRIIKKDDPQLLIVSKTDGTHLRFELN